MIILCSIGKFPVETSPPKRINLFFRNHKIYTITSFHLIKILIITRHAKLSYDMKNKKYNIQLKKKAVKQCLSRRGHQQKINNRIFVNFFFLSFSLSSAGLTRYHFLAIMSLIRRSYSHLLHKYPMAVQSIQAGQWNKLYDS